MLLELHTERLWFNFKIKMSSEINFFIIVTSILPWTMCTDIKFPNDCGRTPMYPRSSFVGSNNIAPDEYPWIASLQYGRRDSYGYCSGSVINAQYVLTAAYCVTRKHVDYLGGLSGVRLGDFRNVPYCDYGTANCGSYKHFRISEIRVHENYVKDSNNTKQNNIALIRLYKSIIFDDILNPICLPLNNLEQQFKTAVTVAGWGHRITKDYSIAKRATDLPIFNKKCCKEMDIICAGSRDIGTCQVNSGSALMYSFKTNQMTIIGIQSQVLSGSGKLYFTDVRKYVKWIEKNLIMG